MTFASEATQQVQAFAVQAMTLAVMTSSMAMMIAAMSAEAGVSATPITPKSQVKDKAFQALRQVYGEDIVFKARVDAGNDLSIENLALKIEKNVYEDMVIKYGKYPTDIAMEVVEPGDYEKAKIIASTLKANGITESSSSVKAQNALNTGVKRAKMAGHHAAQRVLDTWTGITYESLNKAGSALALDYGLPLTRIDKDGKTVPNAFLYYDIIRMDPERLKKL